MRPSQVIALISSLLSVLYLICIIRYRVLRKLRSHGAHRWKAPDGTLGLALLLLTIQAIFMIWVTKRQEYWETHRPTNLGWIPELGLPLNETIVHQKFTAAAIFIYITTIWLIKTTFLLYYYDFSEYLPRRLQIYLSFLSALVGVGFVVNVVLNASWCVPISRAWKPEPQFCSSMNTQFTIAFGSWLGIVTDLLLMVFPIIILKDLNLRGLQQCAVGILPGIAALTAITAVVRFAVLTFLLHNKPNDRFRFQQQWHIASTVEMIVGVFAACQPALRALARRAWRVDYGSYGSGSQTLFRRDTKYACERHGLDRMNSTSSRVTIVAAAAREALPTDEEIRRFPYA